jgi:hypothetical protein
MRLCRTDIILLCEIAFLIAKEFDPNQTSRPLLEHDSPVEKEAADTSPV